MMDEIDEYELMYQHEDDLCAMTEDERRAMYESWLQTLDETERQKIIKEDEQWEKSKPEMKKKLESSVYLSLYAFHLRRGGDVSAKELAETIDRRHPDIEVPSIIADHLCKNILGKIRKKGRPKRLLNDLVKETRDIKLFEGFKQMRKDGIGASECYVELGKIHAISMERARNIVTEKNNRKKQDTKLQAQFKKSRQ